MADYTPISQWSENKERLIEAFWRAKVTPVLIGDPGTGKTETVRSFAKKRNLRLIPVIVSSFESGADFIGLPARYMHKFSDGTEMPGTSYNTPDWALQAIEADLSDEYDGSIIFLDELNTGEPSIMAPLQTIIQDHLLPNGVQLPESSFFISAMNDPMTATNGWDLSGPIANRIAHVKWTPPIQDWIEGMVTNWGNEMDDGQRVHHEQIAQYVAANSDQLHVQPQNDAQIGQAWPSRRTWHKFATAGAGIDQSTPLYEEICISMIGETASMQFMTWIDNQEIPTSEFILSHYRSMDWSEYPTDQLFAMLIALLSYTNGDYKMMTTFKNVLIKIAEEGRQDAAASLVPRFIENYETDEFPMDLAEPFSDVLARSGMISA